MCPLGNRNHGSLPPNPMGTIHWWILPSISIWCDAPLPHPNNPILCLTVTAQQPGNSVLLVAGRRPLAETSKVVAGWQFRDRSGLVLGQFRRWRRRSLVVTQILRFSPPSPALIHPLTLIDRHQLNIWQGSKETHWRSRGLPVCK